MFAYCENDPVNREDPDGHLCHLVVGAVIGAIAGLVGQVASDAVTSIVTGKISGSSWQAYVGAVLGGAAGGATLAATGNVGLANVVTGSATTGIGQSLEKLTNKKYKKTWTEIATNVVLDGTASYALGRLPGVKNISAGRNSYTAVYKSGLTKLRNKTASTMSRRVIRKGIISEIVGGFALDSYYGARQSFSR